MSNAFEFGIGITATDEGAAEAIGKVVTQLSDLENSMTSMGGGAGISEIMGGWDPTAMLPAEDLMHSLNDSLGVMASRLDAINKYNEICGVAECAEQAEDALQDASVAAQKLGQKMSEVPKKTESVGEHFGNVSKAAALLEGSGSQLRFEMTRLFRSMGDTALEADMAASGVLKVAKASKVSWQQVAELQRFMTGAGIEINATTAAGQKQLKTMAILAETHGMTAGEIQKLAGSMKVTGNSLTDLTGVAVKFQKDFRVPGLLNTLPAASEAAVEAQSQFGSAVKQSSRDITVNIVRMTGVYSKALGVTAAEAAQKARGTFMKFTAEIESYEDLFLGLADDFSPLQTAFMETGMGMGEMEDLFRKGKDAPEEFAAEVKAIRDQLGSQMGERFFRQVLRNTDEATRRLLTQEAAGEAAADAAAGAGKEPDDPSATFLAISDAMRENAVDAKKMKDALVGAREEIVKLTADEGIRQGLEAYNAVLQVEIDLLIGVYDSVRNNEVAFKGMNAVIATTTFGMVALNDVWLQFNQITGIGSALYLGVASGFSLLVRGAKGLWRGLTWIGRGFKRLWRGLGRLRSPLRGLWTRIVGLGGRLRAFGSILRSLGVRGALGRLATGARLAVRVFGKLAAPVWLVYNAFVAFKKRFENIGEIFASSDSWGSKIKKAAGEIVGGLWDTFSGFFMGLPDYFVKGFRNVGKKFSTEGAKDMGKTVGKIMAAFGKGVVGFFKSIPGMLKSAWDAVVGFVVAIPSVAKKAWYGLQDVFVSGFAAIFEAWDSLVDEQLPALWAGIKAWWTSFSFYDDLVLPIISGFAAMGDQILGFFGGVMTGMLEAFGMTSDSAAEVVDALGTIIKVVFADAFAWAIRGFEEAGDYFMLYVVSPIKKGLSHIDEITRQVVEIVRSAFKITFAAIEAQVMSVLSGIVSGMASMADTILGTIQSLGEGINAASEAVGMGEVFDTSGLDSARTTIKGFGDDLSSAASMARDRVGGETEAAAARIMGIRKAAAEERAAMDEADKRRHAAMQANRESFDTDRQERAQVLGKAVDTLMGTDPNAAAVEAENLARYEEVQAKRQRERQVGLQAEIEATKERNRLGQAGADEKFEARKEATRQALRGQMAAAGLDTAQIDAIVDQMPRTTGELAPTPEDLPTMPLGARPSMPMVGPGLVATRARGPAATTGGGGAGQAPTGAGGSAQINLNSTTTLNLDGQKVAESMHRRKVSQSGNGGGNP